MDTQKPTNDKKNDKKDEIEKLKKECEDQKGRYLRALADYQNLEKRFAQDRHEIEQRTQARLVTKLLPVIDNLEQAEVFVKDPGLKLVRENFTQFLHELGIKELDLIHKEYDPHLAEAVEVVDGTKDNEVVEVIKKGYELGGKVIRPAQVKVSKKPVKI